MSNTPSQPSTSKYRPVLTASDISILISKLSPEPSSPDEFRLRVYLQSFLLKSSGGIISPAYIPEPPKPTKYSAAGLGLSDDMPSAKTPNLPTEEEILALQKAISSVVSNPSPSPTQSE